MNIDDINKSFDNITKNISTFLKQLSLLNFDDNRKNLLINNANIWCDYGWTINRIPNDKILNPPNSFDSADAIMLETLSAEEIDSIFTNLCEKIKIHSNDIMDAQFAYNNNKYKLCCMALFAIIDDYCTKRFLRKNTTLKHDDINALITRNKKANTNMFFNSLRNQTFLKVLKKYYKCKFDDDTFKPLANRNVLLHGKSKRPYSQADCIKLLLLLETATKVKGLTESKITVELTPINN